MSNTDNAYGFQFYRTLGSTPVPALEQISVATNVKITAGDAIYASSGKAAVCTGATAKVLGIAVESHSSGAAGTVLYYPALPHVVFLAQASGNATSGYLGEECDLEGSSGSQEVNENLSTADVIRIIGKYPEDDWGTNARLQVVFKKNYFDGA